MSEVIPAEFARMCGVSPSVISRKIKHNTLVSNAAGLLDTDNPVNSRYASKRHLKLNSAALEDDGKNAERMLKNIDFSTFSDYQLQENTGLPKELLGMTIRELVVKYKGMDGLERHVRMLKDLATAEEKDQKTQERRLQLVEKDFIVARLFNYIDTLMKQLLEYPESSVDDIVSLALSEGTNSRQDISRKMENGISKIIKDAKEQIVKELSGLRAKYQEDDKLDEIREAIEDVIGEQQGGRIAAN
jgi:hypothetical protein